VLCAVVAPAAADQRGGTRLSVAKASTDEKLDAAFAALVRERADALLVSGRTWFRWKKAFTFKMRPTTKPSAITSKSSSFHSPDGREAEARLRIR
jgi:hypothetical protein